MHHTPKVYVNTLRIKIITILVVFLAASSLAYWLAHVCRTKAEFVLLTVTYLFVFASTAGALISNFKELRRWKRIAGMFLSLILASTFCPKAEATIALMPGKTWTEMTNTPTAAPPMKPAGVTNNITLCEAVIGMIVIAAGTFVVYSVYKCAKTCLNPPTNHPPTNAPKPPGDGDNIVPNIRPAAAAANYLGADTSQIGWDNTVVTNGWLDWTGSLVTGSFSGVITNSYLTNADNSVTPLTFQSSTNLLQWTPEYIFINGWVSETSFSTNVTVIVYDQYGNPFSTNWFSSTPLAITGPPIRSNTPAAFFKVSP